MTDRGVGPVASAAGAGVPARVRDIAAFRTYASSRLVAWTGSAGSAVVLPVLVYQRTGSPLLTGLLAAAESLPYLLLGVHAGALVDRWDGTRVMVASAVVSAVALATVPVADLLDLLTAAQLLVVALVGGVSFVFLDAAAFGTLPRIVGQTLIGSATAFLGAAGTVVGIAVPAVVGVVLPLVGGVAIVAADAVLCLLSASMLGRVGTVEVAEPRAGTPTRLRDDVREGLAYIWRHPVIRPLTVLGFGNGVTGGAVVGLVVVVGVEHLGFAADDGRFGWVYAAAAVGSFLGATLIGRVQRRVGVGPISTAGYALMAVVVLAWAVVDAWVASAGLLALEGVVSAVIIFNGIITRQTLTPMRLQGRVNTTARVIAWGGAPLGAALGGALAELYDVTTALVVCTAPVAAASALAWWWRLPVVGLLRDLETHAGTDP